MNVDKAVDWSLVWGERRKAAELEAAAAAQSNGHEFNAAGGPGHEDWSLASRSRLLWQVHWRESSMQASDADWFLYNGALGLSAVRRNRWRAAFA